MQEIKKDRLTLHVAVAVIMNEKKEVLIAKRPKGKSSADKWEFPGGKIEEGETALEALIREMKEEVNIDVEQADSFLEIQHDYPEYSVLLDIFLITHFKGEAYPNEGQLICWAAPHKLSQFDFLEASKPIVNKLYLDARQAQ